MKSLRHLKNFIYARISNIFGIYVIVVATEEDRQRILDASEFQPNDVY